MRGKETGAEGRRGGEIRQEKMMRWIKTRKNEMQGKEMLGEKEIKQINMRRREEMRWAEERRT